MSLRLRLLNAFLKSYEKPRIARVVDPKAARLGFYRQSRLFRTPPFTCILDDNLGNVPAIWSYPSATRRGVILYFHGGAYVVGSPKTHLAMIAKLAALAKVRACVPAYRLAPEHPFPAAVDDAWTVWQELLRRGYPAESIILGGDSAGGGLMLSLLSRICTESSTRPAAAFAISPWTDLTMSGSSITANVEADRLLPASRLAEVLEHYLAGQDPADPRASPLFAEFPHCPPVYLLAADTEILLDDSVRMAARLREFGAHVSLDVWGDLPHVWPIFQGYLPEADEALRRIAAFTKAQLLLQRQSES